MFLPQTMAVKLQPPSGTQLPAFNPILPPAAVTQILLLANPHKVNPELTLGCFCIRRINIRIFEAADRVGSLPVAARPCPCVSEGPCVFFQEKVQLQYSLAFTLGEQAHSESGSLEEFPAADSWGNL